MQCYHMFWLHSPKLFAGELLCFLAETLPYIIPDTPSLDGSSLEAAALEGASGETLISNSKTPPSPGAAAASQCKHTAPWEEQGPQHSQG